MNKLIRNFCTGLTFIMVAIPVNAIESSNGLKVDVGAFFSSLDTVIHGNNGVTVDFETDLNMEDTDTQPIFSLGYRFYERHFIDLEYFSLSRQGFKQLIAKSFTFTDKEGDEKTVDLGAQTNSTLDMDIYRLSYGYRFVDKDKWALAALIGIHTLDVSVDISAKAGALDTGTTTGEIAKESQAAPLPNIGFYAEYQPSKSWGIVGGLSWLNVAIGDYSGSMMQYEVGLYYSLNQHFRMLTTYSYFDVEFKEESATSESTPWNFAFKYRGPVVVLQYAF